MLALKIEPSQLWQYYLLCSIILICFLIGLVFIIWSVIKPYRNKQQVYNWLKLNGEMATTLDISNGTNLLPDEVEYACYTHELIEANEGDGISIMWILKGRPPRLGV
jgi:hypothetical protein